METGSESKDTRPVFFFDIDNCLYPRNRAVYELMQSLIDDFFVRHLSLSAEDANTLHVKYYKEYGLAIEGLARHHKIDPMVFNREVDDALPLDEVLSPDPELRRLLEDIDTSRVKLWLLTNAHITHGKRVVKLLGVEDLFEGITYCDYAAETILCKPHMEMYAKAEMESGAVRIEDCYFVDDSRLNCEGATKRGWTAVHLVEPQLSVPDTQPGKHQIRRLEELRGLFPQFFKTGQAAQKELNGSA